jgi:hypothetical protein
MMTGNAFMEVSSTAPLELNTLTDNRLSSREEL